MESNYSNNIQVELIWIRHGISCSNLLGYTRKMFKEGKLVFEQDENEEEIDFKNLNYQDPHLSNFGISHLNNIVNTSEFYQTYQPDLIACSQLIRTMETAYLLFYNDFSNSTNSLLSKLFVCPYISEFESSNLSHLENEVKPFLPHKNYKRFQQFKEYLSQLLPTYYPINKNVELVYLSKNESNQNRNAKNMQNINNLSWNNYFESPRVESYNLFIQTILPKLINKVLTKDPLKRTIKIAVACHGNFIGKHVLNTYQFVEKINNKGNPIIDNHGNIVLELKDKDVNSEKVKIFYSPPKNADAYEEVYIFDKSNRGIKRATDLTIQVFPENPTPNRVNSSFSGPGSRRIHRDKDTRFLKYDKFPFLFEPSVEGISFDIRDRYVQTKLLKAIKLRNEISNGDFDKMLKTVRFWNNIMGLCFMEHVDKMYTQHYLMEKNTPLLLDGGKIKLKKKIKSKSKSKKKDKSKK
jgi:hypothetical protein